MSTAFDDPTRTPTGAQPGSAQPTDAQPTDALAAVRARLAPVLREVAAGTVAREQDHELPFAAVRALLRAGLGRLRLPVSEGSEGLDLVQVAGVLVSVAGADSYPTQAFHRHLGCVEQVLALP